MMRLVKTVIAVLGGVGIGAVSTQALLAQAKPPAYIVAEVTVKDQDPYMKEFLPARRKAIRDAGGKYIVRSGDPKAVAGEPSGQRIAIIQFENMDKLIAFTRSTDFRDSEVIGEKYANIRIYAVEGFSGAD